MKRNTAASMSDPQANEARRATFIVRMWTESEAPDQSIWRGTVEHAQSGERRAVVGAEELLELIATWLAKDAE